MKFISIITLFLTTSLFSMPSSLIKDITNDLIRINQEEKENVRNPKFWFDYANTKTNRIDPFGEWGRWLPNVFSAYYSRGIGLISDPKQKINEYKNLVNSINRLPATEENKKSLLDKINRKINALNNINKDLSNLSLPTLGETFNVSDYKGKIIIVDFFATWCRPCVLFSPKLEAIKAKYGDRVEILVVSLDTNKQALVDYFKNKPPYFHVNYDGTGWDNELYKQYAISGIPSIALINKDGILVDILGRTFLEDKVNNLVHHNTLNLN